MKKLLTTVLVLTIIFVLMSIIHTIETHYTRDVVVVHTQDEEVIVQDRQGHLWTFIGEGYTKDQEITVVMYTNNTDSIITDDEIIRIKS